MPRLSAVGIPVLQGGEDVKHIQYLPGSNEFQAFQNGKLVHGVIGDQIYTNDGPIPNTCKYLLVGKLRVDNGCNALCMC